MCCGDDVSGSSPRCPSRVGSSRGTCVSWRFADRRSVCLFPVQSGVPGFLTDMQKACSNYGSYCQKKWNATDGTAAHAQGLGFSLPVLASMIKLDFFLWWWLLLVAVACCLLRHDVHDQPSSIISWCWISSVPLYCTNWILCCLFCATAVHSTFHSRVQERSQDII